MRRDWEGSLDVGGGVGVRVRADADAGVGKRVWVE
jgi:hypothetical protein